MRGDSREAATESGRGDEEHFRIALRPYFSHIPGDTEMSGFVDRIVRASKLDASLYEEVEHDRDALRQAMTVVVLSSIAGGIGLSQNVGLAGMLLRILVALAGWYVWAALAYFIGTRLLPEPQTKSEMGEMLRTIGFSSAPGLIRVLGVIPNLASITVFASSIWMFAAMVVAVRQALDYQSTLRAVTVCLIGLMVQFLFVLLLLRMIAGAMP